MSTLPLPEAIMLEIRQCLGGQSLDGQKLSSEQKRKFATAEAELLVHSDRVVLVMKSIFDAFGMDLSAKEDALKNFLDFVHAYKTVELNTWTFEADLRQIIWMLSGYFYMPGLARHVAFWSLEEALDKGMPGGRFWYLPEQCEKNGKPSLNLPVAQVVDWLLDLLDVPSEKLGDEYSDSMYGDEDGLRRSLYNWRNSTTLQLRSIDKYFSDDVEMDFDFKGAFKINEDSTPVEQFASALDFVERKGLTANSLRLEIPITQPGCLEAILDGDVGEDVQMTFVDCLAERYAEPSNHTIRQRLLLARMVQDGYSRMLKFLCPGVDRLCADPKENKILQLINIYKFVHNLTVDAWRNCGDLSVDGENVWFEKHLPELDTEGLYLSILPSRYETSNYEVAHLLTRRFYETRPGEELEDHVGYDGESLASVTMRNVDRIKTFFDEQESISSLTKRIKRKAPEPILQSENRYWVMSQVAGCPHLRPRAKMAAVQRMRELASTPAETIQAICIELGSYLNDDRTYKKKDTQSKVQALIEEAESNEAYGLWRAAILQYKAKHLLAQNDFVGAVKLFREALEAAKERNFGPVRGEVARDCFAVELANRKLTVNNHEKYYREMLAGGILDENEKIPPIEEVARSIFTYFWESLYRTYYGVPKEQPRSLKIFKEMSKDLIDLFSGGDRSAWKAWMGDNAKVLKSNLPDVEGNTILMLLIKMRISFQAELPLVQQMMPSELLTDLHRFESMLEHWRQFLGEMVEMAPNQLNIRDLKGQTPLMLVAEDGDAELVQAMLKAGAGPDIQDWQGMTALHSAVKSYDNGCVDALLEHPCSLTMRTIDGRSPLHTASWSGNTHAVERLLGLVPELALQRDDEDATPLELVKGLIADPSALTGLAEQLAQNGRRPVSKQKLLDVAKLLEQVTPVQ